MPEQMEDVVFDILRSMCVEDTRRHGEDLFDCVFVNGNVPLERYVGTPPRYLRIDCTLDIKEFVRRLQAKIGQ